MTEFLAGTCLTTAFYQGMGWLETKSKMDAVLCVLNAVFGTWNLAVWIVT